MEHPAITLRSLARELGLSPTTVSDALRGRGRVNAETAARVRQAADRLGFRINPLMASVLSEVRRGRQPAFRGVIAALDLYEDRHWPHGPFPKAIVDGAQALAVEQGFSVELFVAGGSAMSIRRLDSVFAARGIEGLIILPSWFQPDLSGLTWSRYAAVYTDFIRTEPRFHTVCMDHYGTMFELLERLVARAYRRPGYVLQGYRGERVQRRQTAAFIEFQTSSLPAKDRVPLLSTHDLPTRAEFVKWLRRCRPDVVLTHYAEVQDWLEAESAPGEVGFVLLNSIDVQRPCACLDQQPRLIGEHAAQVVINNLLRGGRGIPETYSRTTIGSRWIEGPTVRPPPEPAAQAGEAKAERTAAARREGVSRKA